MLAWLRAALREVVVISASPVIAQPRAWRSAGPGWRCWPVRAVTRWPGWTLLPVGEGRDGAGLRQRSASVQPGEPVTAAGEARIAA